MVLEVALDALFIRTNHVTYVIGELFTCFWIFMQYSSICFITDHISVGGIAMTTLAFFSSFDPHLSISNYLYLKNKINAALIRLHCFSSSLTALMHWLRWQEGYPSNRTHWLSLEGHSPQPGLDYLQKRRMVKQKLKEVPVVVVVVVVRVIVDLYCA